MAELESMTEGVDITPLPESEATPTASPVSAARIELGLGAPGSEDEMQLAALVDLAESILPVPGAWRVFAEALAMTVAQLRVEVADASMARLGIPAPMRSRFRKTAIERALAKPGLAVVALIGSRSHSAANVSAALEAAARKANVFQ
jgi:hypothetical protein